MADTEAPSAERSPAEIEAGKALAGVGITFDDLLTFATSAHPIELPAPSGSALEIMVGVLGWPMLFPLIRDAGGTVYRIPKQAQFIAKRWPHLDIATCERLSLKLGGRSVPLPTIERLCSAYRAHIARKAVAGRGPAETGAGMVFVGIGITFDDLLRFLERAEARELPLGAGDVYETLVRILGWPLLLSLIQESGGIDYVVPKQGRLIAQRWPWLDAERCQAISDELGGLRINLPTTRRICAAYRGHMARKLAAEGWSRSAIAIQLGVTERHVRMLVYQPARTIAAKPAAKAGAPC